MVFYLVEELPQYNVPDATVLKTSGSYQYIKKASFALKGRNMLIF